MIEIGLAGLTAIALWWASTGAILYLDGLSTRTFRWSMAIATLIAASCSFLSPVGYQTNLMVFGLGGYRFTDFARVGAPLTLSTIVTSAIVIPIAFG